MVKSVEFSLTRVQITNLLLIFFMPLAGAMFSTWRMAESILIGALLANLSFLVMKNDLLQLMQGPLQAVKIRFFIKYYLRLSLLALFLYFLVRYGQVQVFGLLFGLSTVVSGIVVGALSQVKAIYFSGKEAL